MIKKLEPVQIYECPCCNLNNSDADNIRRHIAERKKELPIGLVYGNNKNRDFVIVGTYGFDKNHLASHLALSLDESFNRDTYLVNYSDFVLEWSAGFNSFLHEEQFVEA